MKVKVWFFPIIFPPFLQFHKSDSRSSIATCGKGLPYWTELIQNISTTAKNSIGQECCRGEKAQEAGEPMETKTQIVPGAWKWSSDPWLSEVMLLWVSFLYLLGSLFFFFFLEELKDCHNCLGRKDCNWKATLWSPENAVILAHPVASGWEERVFPQGQWKDRKCGCRVSQSSC